MLKLDNRTIYEETHKWRVHLGIELEFTFFTPKDPTPTPLAQWDVSAVTKFNSLFAHPKFDANFWYEQDISNWKFHDTEPITMKGMFRGSGFHGFLGSWDVGRVTNMAEMFADNPEFDYLGISRWDVSNVTNMNGMFRGTNCNDDISGWDVGKVTDMSKMFENTVYFNQSLSGWNVESVVKINGMFHNAQSFTCIPASWVDKLPKAVLVARTYEVFYGSAYCKKVVGPTYLDDFLKYAEKTTIQQPFIDKDQLSGALSTVEATNNPVVGYFGHVGNWDVSNISDFSRLASSANLVNFNYDISGWLFHYHYSNLSFEHMFSGLLEYNQPFHFKTTGNYTIQVKLDHMFSDCPKLNSPISFSGVEIRTMAHMFENCTAFNAPVTINCSDEYIDSADYMFYNCKRFNQPVVINGVTYIEQMNYMFAECHAFNQPIGWFVRCDKAQCMMLNCKAFNKPMQINALCFHNSDCVENMFSGCTNLHQTITFEKCCKDFTLPVFTDCPATFALNFEVVDNIVPNDSLFWNQNHAAFNHVTQHATLYQNPEPHRTITLPWRVRIETWNNESVPILVIPRGTLLFTGRRMHTPDHSLSMRHLWKLATGAPSYTDQNLGENLLTYFYPIPYMNQVITHQFCVIDMVETTQDFRLICLVRPSHLTRGHRQSNNVSFLSTCPGRGYDLCVSRRCMQELRLQGYMGIAGMDSITSNGGVLSQIDILVQACAVSAHNATLYLGVPEIVLISPVCIEDLDAMDAQYAAAIANQPLPKPVPFQSVHQFTAPNTTQLINTIHAEFQTNDRWSDLIGASRQAPCMLFVNKQTTSLSPDLYESIEHEFTQRDYQLEISYRDEDPKIIVAIQQGGYFLSQPNQRLRGAGIRPTKRRSLASSDWVVKTFGCMPIVLRRRAVASRPSTKRPLSTRKRLVTPKRVRRE